MRLAEGMTAGDKCKGLFKVHCHSTESLFYIGSCKKRIGVTVWAFRIYIDETHLNGAKRILQDTAVYRNFRIVRYKTGKPETVEAVKIVTEYLAEDSTILAYKLLAVPADYTFEVTWYYK